MKEVNPRSTTRAYAFEMWMKAPMPMLTFFKALNVSKLLRVGRRKNFKFNMLENYLRLTQQVAQSCENHDIPDSMVIGTSALAQYEIDGAHAAAFLYALQREIDKLWE